MDGGTWWAAVHEVAESRARLSDFTFTFHFHALEKEMATHSSGLPLPSPGDLPDPGIQRGLLCLLHWQAGSLPLAPPGKPIQPPSLCYFVIAA